MVRNWTQTLLVLALVGAGLLGVALLALWGFVSATATDLHPNPQDAPSVTFSAPSPEWAEAVERGRQVVRAGLLAHPRVERNVRVTPQRRVDDA